MKRCPACGNEYRSGAMGVLLGHNAKPRTARVTIERMELNMARVCKPCAGGGLLVVSQKVPTPEPKGRQYTHTEETVKEAIRTLRTYAKVARATGDKEAHGSPEYCSAHGRAEGFEGAIELLKGRS